MGVYYYVMGQDHYPFTTPFGSNLPLAYPAARFTYAPLPPVAGQPVVFNASTTTCTNGTIIRYDWDFGDGENGTGQTVSHTYSTFGNYNVTLTAMSNTRIPDTENQATYVRRPPLPLWETWTLVAAGITTIVVASIAISLAAKRINTRNTSRHARTLTHTCRLASLFTLASNVRSMSLAFPSALFCSRNHLQFTQVELCLSSFVCFCLFISLCVFGIKLYPKTQTQLLIYFLLSFFSSLFLRAR